MDHSKTTQRILIDTNVIMDVMLEREPFFCNSKKILDYCSESKVKGYVAVHTIPTLWYLIRKSGTDKMCRDFMSSILEYLDISGMDKDLVIKAIARDNFPDFEDCLQDECAAQIEADCIITRNKNDFCSSKVPAFLPEEFLQQVI